MQNASHPGSGVGAPSDAPYTVEAAGHEHGAAANQTTASHRLTIAIAAAVVAIMLGGFGILPNAPGWAAILVAAGQIWASRSRRSWFVAGGFLLLGGLFLGASFVEPFLRAYPALPFALGTVTAIVVLARRGLRRSLAPAALAVTIGLLLTLLIPGGALLQVRFALVEAKLSGSLPHVSWPTVAQQFLGAHDFTVDYFGMRYSGDSANLIDSHVLLFGTWEPHVLNFLRTCAASLRGGSVAFIDVGANTGLHSLYMSRHAGQVHGFDPYPPVVAKFRSAVEANHLSNVTVHEVGLGDADALLPFHSPLDSNEGTGSFLWGADHGNSDAAANLRIVRGDEYFQENSIRADIIKMDIEGYEKPALHGLRAILERDRPIVEVEITAERGRDGLFESFEDLQAAFPADYRFFVLGRGQGNAAPSRGHHAAYELAELDLDFQGPFNQRDVAAIPAELLSRIPQAGGE